MSTLAWGSGLSADRVLTFAGNCELTAMRIASSAVALDWVRFGGNPKHYWTFDEGSGTSAADSGAVPRTMTLNGGSWETASPWIGPADLNPNWTNVTLQETYVLSAGTTIECWAYCIVDGNQRVLLQCGGLGLRFLFNWPSAGYWLQDGNDWAPQMLTSSPVITTGWHHLAAVWDSTGGRLYVDGVQAGSYSGTPPNGWIGDLYLGYQVSNWTRPWAPGKIGDFAMYTSAKYTSNFTPTRYQDGSIVLTDSSFSGPRKVTTIDWIGTFGDNYGRVYRIQVNTGTNTNPNWVTVGGDYPSSPISGLDLTVPSGTTRLVRVYLQPKADTKKTETPVLNALRIVHVAPGGVIRPLGPGLTRVGAIPGVLGGRRW